MHSNHLHISSWLDAMSCTLYTCNIQEANLTRELAVSGRNLEPWYDATTCNAGCTKLLADETVSIDHRAIECNAAALESGPLIKLGLGYCSKGVERPPDLCPDCFWAFSSPLAALEKYSQTASIERPLVSGTSTYTKP